MSPFQGYAVSYYRDQRRITMRIKMLLLFCYFVKVKTFWGVNDSTRTRRNIIIWLSVISKFCEKILIFNKITNNKITKWIFEVRPQRAKMALRGSDRGASLAVEWNGVVWWCTPWRRDVPRVRCWYESSDLAFSMLRCSRCQDNMPGRALFLLYRS